MKNTIENSDHNSGSQKKALLSGCLAHLINDGISDTLYVLFPIWQMQFGLSFAEVGFLKTLFSGSLASFQVPSGFAANRWGEARVLIAGTAITCLAVLLFGWAVTPVILALLLILGGLGESVQHPISSSLISSAYPEAAARRTALSTFNVAGDIGKLLLPGMTAYFIAQSNWQVATKILACLGLGTAFIIYLLTRRITTSKPATVKKAGIGLIGFKGYEAFWSLSLISVIDSATRMGFLTFFPFLLKDKGADITTIGLALTLVFAGGAAGKYLCGIAATRLGVLKSVILTEVITALCILVILAIPLNGALILAPLLGVSLNGTSSVLYGSVPELVSDDKRSQAFAMFYTAAIGSGAISPPVYGLLSDVIGIQVTIVIVAALVLLTIPLTIPLRGKLAV